MGMRSGSENLFQNNSMVNIPGNFHQIGNQTIVRADCKTVRSSNHTVLILDPPWNAHWDIPCPGTWRHMFIFTDPQRCKDVINRAGAPESILIWDCVSSWYVKGRPLKRAKLCFWYGSPMSWSIRSAVFDKHQKFRSVKNSRGSYLKQESQTTCLSDIYVQPISKMKKSNPHEKPTQWIKAMLSGVLEPGDTVYDPYAGSGSAAVACAQLGVRSVHVEIDESYYAKIIGRLSGKTVIHPVNNRQTMMEFW